MKNAFKVVLALCLLASAANAASPWGISKELNAAGAVTDCAVPATPGKAVALRLDPYGAASVAIDVRGTFVATWTIAVSVDGANYQTTSSGALLTQSGFSVSNGSSGNLQVVLPSGPYRYVCVFNSAFTSGAVQVTIEPGSTFLTVGGMTNGANIVPLENGAAANLVAANQTNQGLLVALVGDKAVASQPAVSTTASASVAADPSRRHIATSCSVYISTVAAQPDIIVNLRDGATGAGTIVWTGRVSCAITSGDQCKVQSPPLRIIGTANTAMTCETAAAPAASNFATATLTYQDAL